MWCCVQALLNRGGRGSDCCRFWDYFVIFSSCHFKLFQSLSFLPGVDFVEERLQLESTGKAGPENECACEKKENKKEEENKRKMRRDEVPTRTFSVQILKNTVNRNDRFCLEVKSFVKEKYILFKTFVK